MKKYLILLAAITLFSCNNKDTPNCNEEPKPEELHVYYNEEADERVNKILNGKPVLAAKNSNSAIIRFKEAQFYVAHHESIPYKQPEQWTFYCVDSSGNSIRLESDFKNHRVSNETLDRLKAIYQNLPINN